MNLNVGWSKAYFLVSMSQAQLQWDIRSGPESLPPGYHLGQLPHTVRPFLADAFKGVNPHTIAVDPRGILSPETDTPTWAVRSAPQSIPRMVGPLSYSVMPVQDPWGMAPPSTAPTRPPLFGEGGAGRPPQ